ncbi:hormogonium polysaccharide biosynthesis glycosyltransferase HpsE [Coleofasciculus sp. G2-EDA-02]|uniref:hormogonium polysaccharide biosynthesis glycosyltransferase HpsE n=1 Tax=Coleofasciculus sp. G2-EDA-02 TaxID=3069529 RepID=UPI0032FA7319
MSAIDFTVAICTYNGANRLSEVLEGLRSQEGTENISWEIIIVDNNSTDDTAKVVQEYQANWSEPYPIHYCFEPEQGLAFARRCAIREAKGSLIGFLDDDNLPDSNWVTQADHFGQSHPKAGAYGGQIHGKFEVEPPPGFERIARYFAILEGTKTYCYNERYASSRKKMFPPGAGIVIRKQAWIESVPERPLLPQTNEDLEMLSYIWHAGWEVWFNPEMEIDHFIPKSRFEKEYLMRFFQNNGRLRYQVRMLSYKPWQKPLVTPVYMVNDLRKIIRHFIKYRRVLKTDKVAAGELEILKSIISTPFVG